MAKTDNLKDYLKDLHEGIKTKKPDASRNPQDFRREIESIQSGVSLDPLVNPATAEQILTGRETYDSDGNKVTGTMNDNGQINLTIDGINDESVDIPKGYTEGGVVNLTSDIQNEVDAQEDLIDEIISIVNNKMAGGSSGGGNDEVLKGVIDGSITELVIPEGVTKIRDYAFHTNKSLTTVSIPNSVTSIGNYVFQHCESLTNINIPNSVTSIGSYAFDYCKSLTNINIPNSVTSIGGCAFSSCKLKTIEIPNSITTIEAYAFSYCLNLISVNIPNSVTSIRSGAFQNCTSLTSINIPNNVTSILGNAFYLCKSLTYLEIPSSVTRIESNALQIGSSDNKATIRFEGITPPTISADTFDISKLDKIEVPMSALDTYKSATNWSNFVDYIKGYE